MGGITFVLKASPWCSMKILEDPVVNTEGALAGYCRHSCSLDFSGISGGEKGTDFVF